MVLPANHSELPIEFEDPLIAEKAADSSYPDLILYGQQWREKTILTLSDNIDCDSIDLSVLRQSERVLMHDLSLASNLVDKHYFMIKLKSAYNKNLVEICSNMRVGELLIQVPTFYAPKFHAQILRRDLREAVIADDDSWLWWNDFRCSSRTRENLRVVIELHPYRLPSRQEVLRWLSEPLEAVIVPDILFTTFPGNKLSISSDWRAILLYFLRNHINIIVSSAQDGDTNAYAKYFIDFYSSTCYHIEKMDLPQSISFYRCFYPIAPEITQEMYKNFESDTVKYLKYRDAIIKVLKERIPEYRKDYKTAVIILVNAGQGALLKKIMEASELSKRRTVVYALESNAPVAHCLSKWILHKKPLWNVKVIAVDPRDFVPPQRADIIVWEMYGCFGHTELAPEFLDSADKLLKPDGVSIPKKIKTYITPLMSPLLTNLVNSVYGKYAQKYATHYEAKDLKKFESHLVHRLGNVFYLAEKKTLRECTFPRLDFNDDYTYYQNLTFTAEMEGELSGLAMHFHMTLADGIYLNNSAHPIDPISFEDSVNSEKTHGLCSIVPEFFPFNFPIHVKEGQKIEVHIWRFADKVKCWYEWCCTSPQRSYVHNKDGLQHPLYFRHN